MNYPFNRLHSYRKNQGIRNAEIFHADTNGIEPLFAQRFFGYFSCFQSNAKTIGHTLLECTQRKRTKSNDGVHIKGHACEND